MQSTADFAQWLGPGDAEALDALRPVLALRLDPMLATAVAMAGALLLAIPVTWVYARTRTGRLADRSVLETILVLPVAVAAIVMVVQNSIALAFSLAGIVAAVRFRSALKDTKDAVFLFIAIGIGIAAGSRALDVALVMSLLFTATMLGAASFESMRGTLSGTRAAPAARAPLRLGKRRTAILLVHAAQRKGAEAAVEPVLDNNAKSWILADAAETADGRTALKYWLRLRKSVSPADLLAELRAAGQRADFSIELHAAEAAEPAAVGL
ncbi:MAG: DUF4956 domain-containing protein [Gemmatimonadetes bacterium]|nr:DUF4956 domain-containing protein [Gemmatimonadota bacterium]